MSKERLEAVGQVRLEAVLRDRHNRKSEESHMPPNRLVSPHAWPRQSWFVTGLGYLPQFEHPTQVQFVLQ
jgi:hypothetical protein